jgi:hypothetical protein
MVRQPARQDHATLAAMDRTWMVALIAVTACGAPAAKPVVLEPELAAPPPAVLGAFGVYAWLPKVDAFPAAPEAEGWGMSSTEDGVTHFLVLAAAPEESAAQALARRDDHAATLPPDARLIYQGSAPYPKALSWSLSSIVVSATPVLEAADVASCTLVAQPSIVIDGQGRTDDSDLAWPYVRIAWTAAAQARLQALVAAAPKTRLYLALGDDVVDDWTPGSARDGLGVVELRLPGPDAASARSYRDRNHTLCP